MATETIDHPTLARLVEAGAVRGAHVVGREGGWAVMIACGPVERALAARRSRQIRLFKRLETLVSYLRTVGIPRFDVDAAGYEAKAVRTWSRPDRAEALRRAHAASVHDQWFREQVEEAVREADGPGAVWVGNEDVRKAWARKRADLAARLEAGTKA